MGEVRDSPSPVIGAMGHSHVPLMINGSRARNAAFVERILAKAIQFGRAVHRKKRMLCNRGGLDAHVGWE